MGFVELNYFKSNVSFIHFWIERKRTTAHQFPRAHICPFIREKALCLNGSLGTDFAPTQGLIIHRQVHPNPKVHVNYSMSKSTTDAMGMAMTMEAADSPINQKMMMSVGYENSTVSNSK